MCDDRAFFNLRACVSLIAVLGLWKIQFLVASTLDARSHTLARLD